MSKQALSMLRAGSRRNDRSSLTLFHLF